MFTYKLSLSDTVGTCVKKSATRNVGTLALVEEITTLEAPELRWILGLKLRYWALPNWTPRVSNWFRKKLLGALSQSTIWFQVEVSSLESCFRVSKSLNPNAFELSISVTHMINPVTRRLADLVTVGATKQRCQLAQLADMKGCCSI